MIWPPPLKTPVATIRALTTSRWPEVPEATITPVSVSLPLVCAAAGAIQTTSVVAAVSSATSAPLCNRLIVPPFVATADARRKASLLRLLRQRRNRAYRLPALAVEQGEKEGGCSGV